MKRIIMHIDVNNAFLSWSAIDLLNKGFHKDIRNSFAIIGGDETKRHGIVLAKSIPAKKIGIVSAETLYNAKKKCPNLEIYSPNYEWYQKMSNSLFELLSNYSPDIQICSIDECYLDYTNVQTLYGDVIEFANKIKEQIKKELKFTVNIGIANNKLCAKMASDFLKPDKIHTLYDEEIIAKMYPLPIEDLFGIGKKTSAKLRELKINTIADLANANALFLSHYFKNQAVAMIEKAKGIDNSVVISNSEEQKGISNETTLNKNLCHLEDFYPIISNLSENLCIAIRKKNMFAQVVGVHLKDKNFNNYSHQLKLHNATNSTDEVVKVAKILLKEMWKDEPIRLIGISLTKLTVESNHQVSLFENIETIDQSNKLNTIVDDLKDKYGTKIISVASSVKNTISKKY